MELDFEFEEITQEFTVDMGEVYEVINPNIPSDYGKITYTQDKSIIVS